MTDPTQLFTAAELAEWGRYTRDKELELLLFELSSLLFFALLLLGPLNRWLVSLSERLSAPARRGEPGPIRRAMVRIWGDETWAAAIAYFGLYFLLSALSTLPFGIYGGYLRPQAYGLSNHTPASFAYDMAKSLSSGSLAYSALVFGLFGLKRRLKYWWLVLGLPAALALTFAGALDPFRAQLHFEQTPLPAGPLRSRIEALAAGAGVELGGIDVENASRAHKVAGAYFAGLGPTRRVILLDNLVNRYTEDEVVVAVAHEMGHVKDREKDGLTRPYLAGLAVVPLLFAIELLLRRAARWRRLSLRGPGDPAVLPLLFCVWWLVTFATGPITHSFSRQAEEAADLYALELTLRPDAFVSLMARLARDAKADVAPAPLATFLLHSHPSIMRRVELARSFAASRALPDPLPGRPE